MVGLLLFISLCYHLFFIIIKEHLLQYFWKIPTTHFTMSVGSTYLTFKLYFTFFTFTNHNSRGRDRTCMPFPEYAWVTTKSLAKIRVPWTNIYFATRLFSLTLFSITLTSNNFK